MAEGRAVVHGLLYSASRRALRCRSAPTEAPRVKSPRSVAPFVFVALSSLAACGPAPAVAPPAVTPASAPSSKPAAAAPEAPAGCPDDLRIALGVNGFLEGGAPARFVFEGMATKLDAFPDAALPPELDRKDPRAYVGGEHGTGNDISRPITRKLAIEMGASDDDGPIAVYTETGAAPCIGKPGDYFAVLRAEGWYEPYLELQRRVIGCDPRAAEHGPAFAVRASAPLDRCEFRTPSALSSATFASIDGKTPAKIVGKLPADLEKLGPPGPCAAPGCLRAFSLQGVELPAGPSLYALSISQMKTKPKDAECEVYAEQRCTYVQSLLFRAGPGAAPTRIEVEESTLGGVLVDPRGVRAFVALTHGGMVVGRFGESGAPRMAKPVELYRPHPEDSDYESHSACPYCGP
jgi:hypothetical protein